MRWLSLTISLTAAATASAALADTPKPSPAKATGYSGLGADSLSPQEVARFAAPPLDEQMSRKIQAMLDVRGLGGGLPTNKGDREIFATRLTGVDQVWRQDGPMKFAVQLTGGEDRTTPLALAPDESFVAVTRDIGGGENAGLYLLSLDGGPLKLVQHQPKIQTELQFISDDSRSIYFRANDKDPASYAIYRYDIARDKRELVFDQPGIWRVVDHRGSNWLMHKAIGSTHHEIYEYDLAAKKLTPVIGQGETEQFEVAYGAKPGQILVLTDKLGDFARLYSLEAGKLTPISPDIKHDVEQLAIDQARARIYYTVNEQGYGRLFAVDAKTFAQLAVPKLPGDNASVVQLSHNGRFAELAYDGATLAPQTALYDWQTGKLTTWRTPFTPEIDTRTFAKATLEYYPARDGAKIPMFVRRPAHCDGPCPVVVDFHGGPEGQARPGFSTRAQLFVDAGFTFVQPNVRGSTGYGKAWLHADDAAKRLGVITDIEDAARYIRTSWAANGAAPKIGVTGGSYGGYSVLMAMTYFAGAYDVGVEQVGMSNLVTFLTNTSPYRRALRISEYGDPVADREALVQLSPITHIAKLKAPLLIFQGLNDPRVPVGESVQIYKQLEQRKVPGGLIVFPDEGHGSVKRGNIVLTLGHSIAFFEKYLLAK